MKKQVILVLFLGLGATTASYAHTSDDSMSPDDCDCMSSDAAPVSFTAMDANDNGKIGKEEFFSTVSELGMFEEWDYDSNGVFSEEEWAAFGWDPNDYKTMDYDDDGVVTVNEFWHGWFKAFDRNGDGVWNRDEYNAFLDELRPFDIQTA